MAVATGVGSLPGEDVNEAVRIVLGELPDLPHLPELPARGAIADMTGRTLAMVGELGFDLQPAGWRLTDASGVDHRRAKSLLGQDLDALEEQTQGFEGELKLQVAGPWTLAATVERPRGDRVLADVGARRDLAQALAEAVGEHVRGVRRRVPGARLIVQVDEPALPAVMGGKISTASGFHRHRSVDAPLASAALEWVFAAVEEAGATPAAHCCAADAPIALLRGAGARMVGVDVAVASPATLEQLGQALDAGERVFLGVAAAVADSVPGERSLLDRVGRVLDMLGIDPAEVSEQLVLTPACGLAGASPAYARELMARLRRTAAEIG